MKNTKLPHIHYQRAINSLLDVKRILIDARQFTTAGPLNKFIDDFIKTNV